MKKKQSQKVMYDYWIEQFKTIINAVVSTDKQLEDKNDYDAYPNWLNQLRYCGVSDADWQTFVRVIQDADDPDFRCPK